MKGCTCKDWLKNIAILDSLIILKKVKKNYIYKMAKKILRNKRCKKCNKGLRDDNESNLCSYHYQLQYWKDRRKYEKNKLK